MGTQSNVVYRVVFTAGQWFVRKGIKGQRVRPVGEGYVTRYAAVLGAKRRRLRDGAASARIDVCDRSGRVVRVE